MNYIDVGNLNLEDQKLVKNGETTISTETLTRRKIGIWIKKTSFSQFRNAIQQIVVGQENLEMILFNIYVYLERISQGYSNADSILLTAPSGCGKTETYRAVKQYFAKELPCLPCYQVDASQFTETGFKGADPIWIVGGLLEKEETNGIGIVWIDEIDKKILPSFESNGSNVNAKVQHSFLTIMEGSICPPKKDGGSKSVDTNNTFFIGMGAFDYVRDSKKNASIELGFGADRRETDHYDVITREDLIDAGACYELVGRFSAIYSYHRLAEKDIRRIINMIVAQESAIMEVGVLIEEPFIRTLLKENNSKYGCRLIRSSIRERVLTQYKVIKERRYSKKHYRIVLNGTIDRVERVTEG